MKRLFTTLSQKWPEYLIESLVIIASILGAYALDNWNEDRLDRIKEQQIIVQLSEDYQANLAQLEQKIVMRNAIIKAGESILKSIDRPESVIRDSLIQDLSFLIIDPTFDPIDNDLVSSGSIRLLRNEKLKRLLSNWSSDIIAVQEIENLWRAAANEEYRPFLTKIGLSRDVHDMFWENVKYDDWLLDRGNKKVIAFGPSKSSLTKSEILSYKEIEGFVALSITLNHAANLESFALKKRINEILLLLKQEQISEN